MLSVALLLSVQQTREIAYLPAMAEEEQAWEPNPYPWPKASEVFAFVSAVRGRLERWTRIR